MNPDYGYDTIDTIIFLEYYHKNKKEWEEWNCNYYENNSKTSRGSNVTAITTRTMSISVRMLKINNSFFTAKLLKMDLRTDGRKKTPMLLMMGHKKIKGSMLKNNCPMQSFMALRRRDVKLKMRMISSLA